MGLVRLIVNYSATTAHDFSINISHVVSEIFMPIGNNQLFLCLWMYYFLLIWLIDNCVCMSLWVLAQMSTVIYACQKNELDTIKLGS